jgi:high affinity Mn2+ porin
MTIFYITKARHWLPEWRQAFGGASVAILFTGAATAADLAYKAPPTPPSAAYDWTGFYVGGHMGYASGNSNWTAASGGAVIDRGSLNLLQSYDGFNQGGSWFDGLQAGYNYMLPNRVVVGTEADVSFAAFPNYSGNNIGNTINVLNGTERYSDNVFVSGTVRGRIGYAPGNWLLYATGGLAWTYEKFTLTDNVSGATDSSSHQRLGWAVGGGVEGPLIPNWTIRAEYLYSGFGDSAVYFPSSGQRFNSNLSEQEVRLGLNYHFENSGPPLGKVASNPAGIDPDMINIHGQFTATWQGYPTFRQAPGSLVNGYLGFPAAGQSNEVSEATLYAGVRLWKGAEFWINPEIDHGFGLNGSIGVASVPTAEAFKVGQAEPYARVPRIFVRQTINLGGETEKVAADINQFAGTQTSDRLVLTVGRLSPLDIFDTNKYASSPRTQFMNWGLNYNLSFDWGADAWGSGYGAAAEWYQGPFTYRLGWFDLGRSAISDSIDTYGIDPTFSQYQLVGEIERRYELWGQPGKAKLTVNMDGGRMGTYSDAIAYYYANGGAAGTACGAGTPQVACVRNYTHKVDVHINIEQAITQDVGIFARAGWAPGYYESYQNPDSNLFISGGVSVSGRLWNRPEDTIGVGVIRNQISKIEQQYLNLGGLGAMVGDGALPNPRAETVLETYYNYQFSASTSFGLDYQLLMNPAFNGDRGPINIFASRVHWQF